MDVAIRALAALGELSRLLESQPHVEPIRQARGALDAVLDEQWSRIVASGLSAGLASALALATYYACIAPASRVLRWLAWLAFVVGAPAFVGYIAWIVPDAPG